MEKDRETKQLRHNMKHLSLSARSCSWVITCSTNSTVLQAIPLQTDTADKKQVLYNLFAAYIHTVPLEELIKALNEPD
jgi:hypothetical protein